MPTTEKTAFLNAYLYVDHSNQIQGQEETQCDCFMVQYLYNQMLCIVPCIYAWDIPGTWKGLRAIFAVNPVFMICSKGGPILHYVVPAV